MSFYDVLQCEAGEPRVRSRHARKPASSIERMELSVQSDANTESSSVCPNYFCASRSSSAQSKCAIERAPTGHYPSDLCRIALPGLRGICILLPNIRIRNENQVETTSTLQPHRVT